ncbi:hypothetical protein AB6A23_17830 [Paenibacillus tarimensis]
MNVIQAHVRGAVERDGVQCAEVEVRTDDPKRPELLVYFSASKDNDYDMHSIVNHEANTEIDWFDNNLHEAFREVSGNMFETYQMKTDWGQREFFKESVLSFGNVREEIFKII